MKKILNLVVFTILIQSQLLAQDAGVSEIITPKTVAYCHKSTVDFTFVVTNFGTTSIVGLPYFVIVSPVNTGGAPFTSSGIIPMSLAGTSDTITLPNMDISLTDNYLFTAYTLLSGDINPNNDILLAQPSSSHPKDSVISSNLYCNGDSSGAINIIMSNGFASYNYNWSNSALGSNLTNLPAGMYSYIVTDSTGCIVMDSVFLTEPALLSASAFDNGNGAATVTVSGGTSPYTYLWDNGDTTATVSGLTNGTHIVTITDFYNCMDTVSVNIVITSIETTYMSSSIQIYPNPIKDRFAILMNDPTNSSIELGIFSLRGELVFYSEFVVEPFSDVITIDGLNLPAGAYLVQFVNNNNVYSEKLLVR